MIIVLSDKVWSVLFTNEGGIKDCQHRDDSFTLSCNSDCISLQSLIKRDILMEKRMVIFDANAIIWLDGIALSVFSVASVSPKT